MDYTNTYREYSDAVLMTTFDIQKVLGGTTNEFSEDEFKILQTMRDRCEKFIDEFVALEHRWSEKHKK